MKYQMARQGWNQAPQTLLDIDQIVELCPIINTEKVCTIFALLRYPCFLMMIIHFSDPGRAVHSRGRLHRPILADPRYCCGCSPARSHYHATDWGHQSRTVVRRGVESGYPQRGSGCRDCDQLYRYTHLVMGMCFFGRSMFLSILAGFWAKDVAKMCDMNLPLVPMEHQYVVSKSVPEIQALKREIPVLRDLNGSYYLRQERDGILVGPYEMDAQARTDWVWNALSKIESFLDSKQVLQFTVFQGYWGRTSWIWKRALPSRNWQTGATSGSCNGPGSMLCYRRNTGSSNKLKNTWIFWSFLLLKSMVNGPITYTPDVLPAIGPTLMPNMWLAVGFAYGIVHAGGVGQYLANWILKGEPEYSLTELDPLRW